MRKREQRKQHNGLADFGNCTPISGHNRMADVDIPRWEGKKQISKSNNAKINIKMADFNKLVHLTRI